MTGSELAKRITDIRGESKRYEEKIAVLEEIVERLNAKNNELNNTKADLEDDNRHLAERVKMLKNKRSELLDEIKRVNNNRERDFTAGKIAAYCEAIRMVLDLAKE